MGWPRGAEVPRIPNDMPTSNGQQSAACHAVMEATLGRLSSLLPVSCSAQSQRGERRANEPPAPGPPLLRGVYAFSLRCLR